MSALNINTKYFERVNDEGETFHIVFLIIYHFTCKNSIYFSLRFDLIKSIRLNCPTYNRTRLLDWVENDGSYILF